MFSLKCDDSNFHKLESVDRGSETQFQMSKNLDEIT